tara:strand:- start:73 stop:702 length:630 start_codon:yes stop_codon:yes gene_type:complete
MLTKTMQKIDALFATPIYSDDSYKINDDELNFVKNVEYIKNHHNLVSKQGYILNHPKLKNLKNYCESKLLQFFIEIYAPTDPIQIFITSSWSNKTKKGERHHSHDHPNSILSGVFYVDVGTTDCIEFIKTQQSQMIEWNTRNTYWNSVRWKLPVKNNLLIMFKSSLSHEVPEVLDDKERLSIAFNSFIKGSIGDNYRKDKLYIDFKSDI